MEATPVEDTVYPDLRYSPRHSAERELGRDLLWRCARRTARPARRAATPRRGRRRRPIGASSPSAATHTLAPVPTLRAFAVLPAQPRAGAGRLSSAPFLSEPGRSRRRLN